MPTRQRPPGSRLHVSARGIGYFLVLGTGVLLAGLALSALLTWVMA